MKQYNPTHVHYVDDFGSTENCEVVKSEGPLSTIRVDRSCYWEDSRIETDVVPTASLESFADISRKLRAQRKPCDGGLDVSVLLR